MSGRLNEENEDERSERVELEGGGTTSIRSRHGPAGLNILSKCCPTTLVEWLH